MVSVERMPFCDKQKLPIFKGLLEGGSGKGTQLLFPDCTGPIPKIVPVGKPGIGMETLVDTMAGPYPPLTTVNCVSLGSMDSAEKAVWLNTAPDEYDGAVTNATDPIRVMVISVIPPGPENGIVPGPYKEIGCV